MKIKSLKIPIMTTAFVTLTSLLIFDAATPPPKNPSAKNPPKEISGKAWVTDGDTIKFGKKRIRLINIDAPESKQKCFDKNGKKYACGQMSKEHLIEITKDRKVTCKYHKRDIYKRYLAECFTGKKSLNQEMVRSGMAIYFSYSSIPQRFKDAQKEAKKNRSGIWQGAFQLPKDYRKQKTYRKRKKEK